MSKDDNAMSRENKGSVISAPYPPADKATMYFIGVTTGKSSIMKVFPAWADYLNLGDVELKGIDLKLHDKPENYREVVEFIRNDPKSYGALVTTHKIDLYQACKKYFDLISHDTHEMGEVSSIYKFREKLAAEAKDGITSGLALNRFLPEDHWKKTRGEVFIMGAGGSSIALSSYIMRHSTKENRPRRIIVSNRSRPRLEEIERIHRHIYKEGNPRIPAEYHLTPEPADNDEICSGLSPGSLVVNGTGLGKDTPGSPLTDEARFPENGIAWEFNYRGDLLFLEQARAQEKKRHLKVIDGWDYFIYGWTRVIADVFHVDIPTEGEAFERISEIAAEHGR